MDSYRIVWNDRLSIGDDYIDSQHKKLIELIGAIPENSAAHDPDLLTEAMQYAASHFSSEEKYMAKIQYPGLAVQKGEHKKLMIILQEYRKEYEKGKTNLYSFRQFMFRWVRDHIMDEDRKIGLFVKAGADKPAGGPVEAPAGGD